MGEHKRTDPVQIWFFIVLGALVAAVSGLMWVVSNGIHL